MKTDKCKMCDDIFLGDDEFCFDCRFAMDYLLQHMEINTRQHGSITGKNVAAVRHVLQTETGRTVSTSVAAVVYVMLCAERQKYEV